MDDFDGWRPLIAPTRPPRACQTCGLRSGWHPGGKGWIFRFRAVRGQPKSGPKVMTEWLCPSCALSRIPDLVEAIARG